MDKKAKFFLGLSVIMAAGFVLCMMSVPSGWGGWNALEAAINRGEWLRQTGRTLEYSPIAIPLLVGAGCSLIAWAYVHFVSKPS